MTKAKSFDIPKRLVWEAYSASRPMEGLRVWTSNPWRSLRVSSGTICIGSGIGWLRELFPAPGQGGLDSEKSGGERTLGIPTSRIGLRRRW